MSTQERRIVTPEEFEACGGDPSKLPWLNDEINKAVKENEPQEETATQQDLFDGLVIAGLVCSSLSIGIIKILDMAKNPLFHDNGKDFALTEQQELDAVFGLFFALSYPDKRELFNLVKAGDYEQELTMFMLEFNAKEIESVTESLTPLINSLNEEPGDPEKEGESTSSKKK